MLISTFAYRKKGENCQKNVNSQKQLDFQVSFAKNSDSKQRLVCDRQESHYSNAKSGSILEAILRVHDYKLTNMFKKPKLAQFSKSTTRKMSDFGQSLAP